MLNSFTLGPFDPAQPATINRAFACNLYAEPIEIDAPIDLVWNIMVDFERYPDWNPMNRFFRLDGKAEPGHRVTFGPSWGPYPKDGTLPTDHFISRETITLWEPETALAYAELGRFMSAERVQYISQLANGRVRYHTYERMGGPFSLMVRWKFGSKILAGFTANGRALKSRAEAMARQHSS